MTLSNKYRSISCVAQPNTIVGKFAHNKSSCKRRSLERLPCNQILSCCCCCRPGLELFITKTACSTHQLNFIAFRSGDIKWEKL